MNWKILIFSFSLLALVGMLWFSRGVSTLGEKINYEERVAIVASPPESPYIFTTHIVEDGQTFGTALVSLGFTYTEMLHVVDIASSTYDFTRIRGGRPLILATWKDTGVRAYLDYERDKHSIVRVTFDDEWEVEIIPIEYTIEEVYAHATVESSLYISGLNEQIPEEIIMQFADVFAWTIDFSTQVQSGDSFGLLYERRYRDGEYAGTGRVLAGTFVNRGTSLYAFLYEQEEGRPSYFNESGESMVKQFLRAPLNYKRITSGYTTARFHPVIQRNTPHLAIDYAAPIGTPIMAVGDGVVTYAGWNGGFGNYIDIRHNEQFETQYAHLSAYATGIKAGVRVTQGQIIGYVGSTGWSTGPHLHYQIRKNGTLINPLTVDFPPGDPIDDEHRSEFERVVEMYKQKL